MYVIKRVDKDFGGFTVTHKTLDEAKTEVKRLANKHAQENPRFIIYELKKVIEYMSTVVIQEI